MLSGSRYSIQTGKWGAYFHDGLTNRDLALAEVCSLLNVFIPLSAEMYKLYLEAIEDFELNALEAEVQRKTLND